MIHRKVMIIDDDKEFLEELGETLRLSGYEMVVINDVGLVSDAAVKTKPDIILIDLKMPKKTGFQLADELRHISELSNIPIIAMTGFFKEGYQPLMNICGIKTYLKKPFSPLDVISAIEGVLKEEKKI